MGDFIYKYTGWIISIILIIFIGFIILVAIVETERDRYFFSQCMEDGRKEYECAAILRKNTSQFVYGPVVLPVHR